MKKKLVSALLVAAMALSLTACGGGGKGSSGGGGESVQQYNTYLATEPSTLDTT